MYQRLRQQTQQQPQQAQQQAQLTQEQQRKQPQTIAPPANPMLHRMEEQLQSSMQHLPMEARLQYLQNEKTNFGIPRLNTTEEFRRQYEKDPEYLFVTLREMSSRIQRQSRREWTVDEYIRCCMIDLRTLGLDGAAARDEARRAQNGFRGELHERTVPSMYRGEVISSKTMQVLFVQSVTHVPVNLILTCYLNRPPSGTNGVGEDRGSHADLDMYHDMLHLMRMHRQTSPEEAARPPTSLTGCICVFDSKQTKDHVHPVRTICVRLAQSGTDFTNILTGSTMDLRASNAMHSNGHAGAPLNEAEVRDAEHRRTTYEENCRKLVLRDGSFWAHQGTSAQDVLLQHESLFNNFLDTQIKQLLQALQSQKLAVQRQLLAAPGSAAAAASSAPIPTAPVGIPGGRVLLR